MIATHFLRGLVAASTLVGAGGVAVSALDPSVEGAWGDPIPFGVVAIHLHVLPTGQVLFWDQDDPASGWDGRPRIWDPATGSIRILPSPGYDIFCGGHAFQPDGGLLILGGTVTPGVGFPHAITYDAFSDSWLRHPDMNAGRWYPTGTTLPSGQVLAVSGAVSSGVRNDTPQLFDPGSRTWHDLTGAVLTQPLYPFLFVAPDGRVFNAGPERQTSFLDTAGAGAWTAVAETLDEHDHGSAVMYGDGKVLLVGGSVRRNVLPYARAEVIDLQHASPAWRSVAPMTWPRSLHNATLLADGTVLVTGGSSRERPNEADGAVLAPELWNPATETWSVLAPATVPRIYHSTAVLLPDGRVLSAGGGHPGTVSYENAQVFSPPYLFRGPRPTITSAPAQVGYGEAFTVETPDAAQIATVNWIRLSAVTHGFDHNQRINRLAFTTVAGGVAVTTPSSPNLCPPGHYMLFLLNDQGVPSVARIVQIDNDRLFEDGFETGDLSRWSAASTSGGDLGVNAAAAQVSTAFGLSAVLNGSSPLFVEDHSPHDEGRYRARFHFDPTGWDPRGRGSREVVLFAAFQEDAGDPRSFMIALRDVGGALSLVGRVQLDGGTVVKTPASSISNQPHWVELDWRRARAAGLDDGSFQLWVDGVPQATLSGLDNDAREVDSVRLGAMDLPPGASGRFAFDEFQSRRRSYIGPYDPLFADGFESGTLSGWSSSSTDGGDLSVAPAAALASSTLGLQAVVNDKTGLYVQDSTPHRESRYRARFYFDPNGFDPGLSSGNEEAMLFVAFQEEAAQPRNIMVVLRNTGGAYSLGGRVRLDSGTAETAFFPIADAPHLVELDWQRASAAGADDGSFRLWIDGVLQSTLTGMDNDTRAVDYVRLGVISLKAGTSGTMYFDEFVARRQSHIGPR